VGLGSDGGEAVRYADIEFGCIWRDGWRTGYYEWEYDCYGELNCWFGAWGCFGGGGYSGGCEGEFRYKWDGIFDERIGDGDGFGGDTVLRFDFSVEARFVGTGNLF
jgi:hypothetical protein